MPKVTYNNKNAVFFPALKKAVEDYFTTNQLKKTGNWKLHLKTLVLIGSALALYLSLLLVAMPVWTAILSCIALGMISAGIGFDVMHDGCHGSYSSKKWVNELMGLTLNALGGNAFFWKQKHNIIHHTYTNVDGVDDDIARSPFIRMCNTQRWVPAHKYQHLYLPFLYMLASIFWVFVSDPVKYATQKVYTTPMPKMDRKEHVIFWASKALYVVFYMVVPILAVGFLPWLVGFLCMHAAMGFTLTIVFQLAHVVEETEFEFVDASDFKHIENEWAIHQIKTTANFSPKSKLISWYVGGLNFQIEHHLFPRISHVHYPAISKIVEAKCREFGIAYHSMPNMMTAVNSHFRFLRELGKRPENPVAIQKRPLATAKVVA
ncbi:fatty acid desaturase family protein [Taibaiella chishuiensis]|uniref:Linoleoyl-CoA desaturase n=1 Tax=Taibaiella chishuiensis TaxID=1434707 RepID=A0A2P8D0E4_9BACT|nr:acyl-CoA desaturase [Taibaiella chishuiensis]PSK90689.1 linoleoyl-CoA desaturase [Taibaiella chishuiensis]